MKNKDLFEIIHSLGESVTNLYNIIQILNDIDVMYKVYHADGYCFQIEREFISDLDEFINEFGNVNDGEYYYSFDSTMFEGFTPISVENAIKLFQ